jgi:hypothetical protein
MKRKIVLCVIAVLVFTLTNCVDNGETLVNSNSLSGTKWILEGMADVQTDKIKKLEPEDCEGCYTLTFNMDNTFGTHSSTNKMGGRYAADYETNNINITNFGGTKIGEVGDGHLWWDIFPAADSFSIQANKLILFYNGNKNYVLFKSLEK